jgi:hypothetical protein
MNITLTREEAQQVLDLMMRYRTETPLGHQPHMISHKADEAIETLRARLSAPEPEPVAGYRWEKGRTPPSVTFTTPPQPEPPCKTGSQCIGGKCPQCVVSEWQGLTDEQIGAAIADCKITLLNYCSEDKQTEFARAIEAKLKEKNT